MEGSDLETQALRAYVAMRNTLDVQKLVRWLAYLSIKIETARKANATVFAQKGKCKAYGRDRPCVVLAQGSRENLVGLVLAEMRGGKLARIDLCMVPRPETATVTGEYP